MRQTAKARALDILQRWHEHGTLERAVALAIREAERDALERAAKMAEGSHPYWGASIAAAIRALASD